MMNDPFIDRTIGSFRVVDKLGEGGMGAVYRAVHVALGREAALKVLPPHLVSGDPRFAERFMVEARAAAMIDHPNVVRVYDAGEAGGAHFIAMELVRGMDLKDLLDVKRPLSEREALDICIQAARGLNEAARKSIIHRDIKPGNFMITTEGVVKVADFGLAKNLGGNDCLTRSGQIMGTPAYMSPEQAEGIVTDFRSDMYSLGVTLFEMVTGERPYKSETPLGLLRAHCDAPVPDPVALKSDIDPAVAALLGRMLSKKPEDRFPSYDALVAEFELILGRLPGIESSPGEVKEWLSTVSVQADSRRAEERTLSGGRTEFPRTVAPSGGEWPRTIDAGSAGRGAAGKARGRRRTAPAAQGAIRGGNRARIAIAAAIAVLAAGVPAALYLAGVIGGGRGGQSEANKQEIASTLRIASDFEREGKYDEALVLIDRVEALDPSNAAAGQMRARLRGVTEKLGKARARAVFNERWARIVSLKAAAERSDAAEDWSEVARQCDQALAGFFDPECEGMLRIARGRRDLALARAAQSNGDLEGAARLAREAGGHGGEVPGLKAFRDEVEERLARSNEKASRKSRFDELAAEALEKEEPGSSFDPQQAKKLWEEALKYADSSGDRATAEKHAAELSKPVSFFLAMKKARAARDRSAFREAGDAYLEALRTWPFHPDAEAQYNELMPELIKLRADFIRRVFEVPKESQKADRFGNPVTERGGSRIDPASGWPLEIGFGGIDFVLVPAGSFMMSHVEPHMKTDVLALRRTEMREPYYVSKYEITQAQWLSHAEDRYENPFKEPSKPAANLDWDMMQPFILALQRKAGSIADKWTSVRLPLDEEWEYACRAGSDRAFVAGDDAKDLATVAWFKENSGNALHEVGLKSPNAWGIYDMLGNASEQCLSFYWKEFYNGYRDIPVKESEFRWCIDRGGAYWSEAKDCHFASKTATENESQADPKAGLGIRLLLWVSPPEMSDRERRRRALEGLGNLTAALIRHKSDLYDYPESLEDLLEDHVNMHSGARYDAYVDDPSILIDPWGTPYRYLKLNDYELKPKDYRSFALYSFGPNRMDDHGDGDDIR